jgi:hypothetical protein
MRKQGVVLGVIALLAAVWAASGLALTSPKVFSLLDVSSQTASEPIGGFTFNRAPVAGDQFAIADDLYKWAGIKRGARAGRVRGIGTFQTGFGPNFSRPATVLFVAQASLPGGTVLVQGYGQVKPHGPSKFTFPVIGGTGIYANARGYVVVRDLGTGDSNNSNVDFHLLP